LVDSRVEFIVVGGVAAVLEGVPVSTFDLEVVYKLTDENVQRLSGVLTELDAVYVDPAGRRMVPTEAHLRARGHHLLRTRLGRLDVLGSVGHDWGFDWLIDRSRSMSLHGMTIRLLTLEAIIECKEAAGRPKDRAVLDLLRQTLAEQRRRL
jgi:hypothetical protein